MKTRGLTQESNSRGRNQRKVLSDKGKDIQLLSMIKDFYILTSKNRQYEVTEHVKTLRYCGLTFQVD